MTREIRGMLMGVCIVILAIAAWALRDKPGAAPDGAGTTVAAPERK